MRNIFKIYIIILIGGIFLNGCASVGKIDSLRTQNRQNLLQLSIGMTKQQVLEIMGTQSAQDTFANYEKLTVTNPYRNEILQGKDKVFEVYFYLTDKKHQTEVGPYGEPLASSISEDELTPIIFDNNKVTGWGWSFLNDNITKYEIRVR